MSGRALSSEAHPKQSAIGDGNLFPASPKIQDQEAISVRGESDLPDDDLPGETDGIVQPACNGVQGPTATLAFSAILALWIL